MYPKRQTTLRARQRSDLDKLIQVNRNPAFRVVLCCSFLVVLFSGISDYSGAKSSSLSYLAVTYSAVTNSVLPRVRRRVKVLNSITPIALTKLPSSSWNNSIFLPKAALASSTISSAVA